MLQIAEVEGRANQAESDLAELREATASSGSSIEEWRSAYADLQQQHASTQVTTICQQSNPAHRLYSTAIHSFHVFSRTVVVAVENTVAPGGTAQLYYELLVPTVDAPCV